MRDLNLGENFHRIKQALLVFCTAILVSRVPGIGVTGGSGLLGASLKDVDIDLIRVMLWIAAAYYFLGFVLEVLSTRFTNTESAGDKAFGLLSQQINETAEGVWKTANDFEKAVERWSNAAERIHAAMSGDLASNESRRLESGRADLENQARSGAKELPKIIASAKRIEDLANRLSASIGGLGSHVKWTRRLQFYGWELGGAITALATATYAMPPLDQCVEAVKQALS